MSPLEVSVMIGEVADEISYPLVRYINQFSSITKFSDC